MTDGSLSEEVLRIVHAFPDDGRRDAVRALAARVAEVESALTAATRRAAGEYERGVRDAVECCEPTGATSPHIARTTIRDRILALLPAREVSGG